MASTVANSLAAFGITCSTAMRVMGAGIALASSAAMPAADAVMRPNGTTPTIVDGMPCPADSPTNVIVTVTGLKDRRGKLRAEIYSDRQEDLAVNIINRVEIRSPGQDVRVCIPLPGPGAYTLGVLHDRNRDGRLNVFSDGFGFSRNPKLGLGLPRVDAVTFEAPKGTTRLTVVMNYVRGMSVGPLHRKDANAGR